MQTPVINQFNHGTPPKWRFYWLLFAIATGVLWIVSGIMPQQELMAGELDDILLDKPVELPDFTLIDHHKIAFTQESLKGKWTFVFFGYTHCPDVCPVTLAEMDKLIELLPPRPPMIDVLQFVFVSVDPDRDTPDHLADYVRYFNSALVGVTGEKSELRKLTKKLKIKFSLETGTDKEYSVNHSSALLLLDPQARYHARFPAPHYVDKIYSQFKQIIEHKL